MSERFKQKVGEELYSQILAAGVKETEFDMLDGYIPRARYNEVNDKYKQSNEKITLYESQLNDTKKLLDESGDYKNKYSSLEEKYNNDLQAKDNEVINITKRYALESVLAKEGAKHPRLLLKEINLENIKVEGENITGVDEVVSKLKESYSDLFVTKKTSSKTGGHNKNESSNTGDIDWKDKLKHIK